MSEPASQLPSSAASPDATSEPREPPPADARGADEEAALISEALEGSDKKTALEIQLLRQQLRHNTIKVIAILLSGFAFVGGFLLDRYRVNEARAYEGRVAAKNRRIDRMVAVAADYDRLYARTSTIITGDVHRTKFLGAALETLADKLKALQQENKYYTEVERFLEEQSRLLLTRSVGFDDWVDGAVLQGEWRARKTGPSPDFSSLFGSDLKEKWTQVANGAASALGEEISLLGDPAPSKKEAYEAAASEMQHLLYNRVLKEQEKEP